MEIQNIRQTVFRVDKDKTYTFDVNSTITFHYLKRMISAAAHLPKNGFMIYHDSVNYTDQDEFTLYYHFPEQQKIEFTLQITNTRYDPDESIIKLKLNEYCSTHSFKYFTYYCYTCSCSICSRCFQDEHINHNVIEKYDYLQSSRHLVDKLFPHPQAFYADDNAQRQSEANELKLKLNNVYFTKLHNMLTQCEGKLNDLIDHFNESSLRSKDNIQENTQLVKEYCSEGLEQLKEDIGIDKIILNEDVFLTFDTKYRDIEKNKFKLRDDIVKYGDLNQKYYSIESLANKLYNDIYSLLDEKLNMKAFIEIRSQINDQFIHRITKEEIIKKIFTEIKVPRKSLKKNPFLDTSAISNPLGASDIQLSPKNIKDNTSFAQPLYSPTPLHTIKEDVPATQTYDITSINAMDSLLIKEDGIVLYPFAKTKTVYIITTNSEDKKDIDFPAISRIKAFYDKASHCNHKNKLYITGGEGTDGNPINTFLKYDPSYFNVVVMPKMENARACHSMIGHEDYIYAVGGANTNTAERFNTNTMRWEAMNPMIFKERQYPNLHVYHNFLYAFGGYCKKTGCMNTIEKINLRNPKAKWEIVAYQNPDNIDLSLYGSGLIEINNILFFFGGKNNKGIVAKVFNFHFTDNLFRHNSDLIEYNVYFKETKLHQLKESIYWNIGEETKVPFSILFNFEE